MENLPEVVKGLVSVTIPFLNREDFLTEAVESVLTQTYPQWELFLIDDGSTDRSTEIAREFAGHSPERICYLQHPEHRNRGQTFTRNLGAQKSRGEYLAFLDSDDVWLPQKLDHQVRIMTDYPEAILVYGPSEYWYDWDVDSGRPQENCIPPLAPGDKLYYPPSLLRVTHPFGPFGAPGPSSFLIRRTAFEEVGGFVESFNPGTYQLYEDAAFLCKLYRHGPVYVTNRCTDRYRCHAGSMWQQIKGTNREEVERRFYFQWLKDYLAQHPVSDPSTLKAIRKQAWLYDRPSPPFLTRFIRRICNRLAR